MSRTPNSQNNGALAAKVSGIGQPTKVSGKEELRSLQQETEAQQFLQPMQEAIAVQLAYLEPQARRNRAVMMHYQALNTAQFKAIDKHTASGMNALDFAQAMQLVRISVVGAIEPNSDVTQQRYTTIAYICQSYDNQRVKQALLAASTACNTHLCIPFEAMLAYAVAFCLGYPMNTTTGWPTLQDIQAAYKADVKRKSAEHKIELVRKEVGHESK